MTQLESMHRRGVPADLLLREALLQEKLRELEIGAPEFLSMLREKLKTQNLRAVSSRHGR